MSNIPTVKRPFDTPKEAFDIILSSIIATDPSKRAALIKPHLQSFLAHPIIIEITSQGKAPAPPGDTPPTTPELKQIQDSLQTLSKAVERLSRGNPPPKIPAPNPRKKQGGGGGNKQPPHHTYSAVAGS